MNELQTLADQIGDSGRYENAFYFFAGYDSPYKVSDRHNEVWLKALWGDFMCVLVKFQQLLLY